jgi:hypothetical protein
MLPGVSFFAGQLSSGTVIYSTPGTYYFTVPNYNILTVEVWGGGAGGGGIGDATGDYNTDGTHYGAQGELSYFANPSFAVVGYGGGYISSLNNQLGGQTAGYYVPNPYQFANASPGGGGIALNGSQNVTGSDGTGGYYGCQGGSSYNGGLTTTYRNTQGAGDAGNAPGGGGGGGFSNGDGIQPYAAGGGGGGGYAKITYPTSSAYRIPEGFVCAVVVGGGGAGGPYNFPGGKGADGQVKIVWS